jgi:hypothetical protein
MDHFVAIVKDFTRARTPDILEVLKNGAPITGAVFAGLRCQAQVNPLTHDLTYPIQVFQPSVMMLDRDHTIWKFSRRAVCPGTSFACELPHVLAVSILAP